MPKYPFLKFREKKIIVRGRFLIKISEITPLSLFPGKVRQANDFKVLKYNLKSSSLTQLSSVTKWVSFTVYSKHKATLCSLLEGLGVLWLRCARSCKSSWKSLRNIAEKLVLYVLFFLYIKSFIIGLYVQDKMSLAGIFALRQDKIIIRCLLSCGENGIESF